MGCGIHQISIPGSGNDDALPRMSGTESPPPRSSSGKNEGRETGGSACLRSTLWPQVRRIPGLNPIAAKVRA